MYDLSLEPTNRCNRDCRHCMRNKTDPPASIPLELARHILSQARALGMKKVCLTGGELATYAHLEGLIRLIAELGLTFNLVTNGFRFADRLLPLLSDRKVKRRLETVCFSLDGARAETHDILRGPGSFREVAEAATLSKLKGIKVAFKSVITNYNKKELTDLALLGATLGAEDHGFLILYPTPRLIREKIIPDPEEVLGITRWIMSSLALNIRSKIKLEGYHEKSVIFDCGNVTRLINIDPQGKLVLCCNLSHVTEGDGIPTRFGEEFLADLNDIPLKDGIIRHLQGWANLMKARLYDQEKLAGLTYLPCYWCFKHFGKLEWLQDFPESPWAQGVLADLPEAGTGRRGRAARL